jgi:hypothetical protein
VLIKGARGLVLLLIYSVNTCLALHFLMESSFIFIPSRFLEHLSGFSVTGSTHAMGGGGRCGTGESEIGLRHR